MATLWVFGDSFGADYKAEAEASDIIEKQWHRMLARELSMQYKNLARAGIGIEYSSRAFFDSRQDIQTGDIVVVTVTETSRRWLLGNRPNVSTPFWFSQGHYEKSINNREAKALAMYFKFLHHEETEEANLYNWICALDHVAVTRGVRVIVLPCFRTVNLMMDRWQGEFLNLHIAKGNLMSISIAEHAPEFRRWFIKHCGRANHLTPPNHLVLNSKLMAYYKNNIPIDLTRDFHESLINDKNFDDPQLFLSKHDIVPKSLESTWSFSRK